jgi:hypothetical protein
MKKLENHCKTYATSRQNTCNMCVNICNIQTNTLATYIYNHCNVCNILIHFCNIHMKHLQHTCETSKTLETYSFSATSPCCLGEWRLFGVWSSPKAVARSEERRRWCPHGVQGGDGRISEEGQSAVLGSHTEFKASVLGGLGRGGASVGGGGQRNAGSEQRGGGGGARLHWWPAGL